MAIRFPNFPENPLNFQKFKKNPNNLNLEKLKKNNPKNQTNILKSLLAFLSSIFIYISIFYIFNLSPSTLVSTTKFWFFISNTLVLIIAADFVAFSSSKELDLHDEYVEKSSKNTAVTSFDVKMVEKAMISVEMNEEEKPREKIITVVETSTSAADHNNHQTNEYEPEILAIEENPNQESKKNMEGKTEEKNKVKCARSNSEKAIVIAAAAAAEEREDKSVLHRTLSERHEETRLEENEFSRMSDEELNRRVEEFIRRCNRQIRLEAVGNRVK